MPGPLVVVVELGDQEGPWTVPPRLRCFLGGPGFLGCQAGGPAARSLAA